MPLLAQTVLASQLLSSPIRTSMIMLPPGCRQATLTLNVSPADLVQVKTLDVVIEMSTDGGVTWLPVDYPGTSFVMPASDPPQLSSMCIGFDGACLRAVLTPDASGVTTDAVVEVD